MDAYLPEKGVSFASRNTPWLAAVLRKRFGHRLEAETEDIVQETYARLTAEAASKVRRPRALLSRIGSNLAKDLLRRRAVRGRHVQQVQAMPRWECSSADPMDNLLFKEALLSIPEDYRDVFVLSRFEGLTYEEIATRCGLSVKAVEWRLARAIALCLKRLQD